MAALSRNRVDAQPAYILHSYPFRETSLIVEAFSRDYGRIALLARGARRPRSAMRGLLMAFQPLELGWAGKGEVPALMKAEWLGGQPLLTGRALFCGYYLNELLLHLLPREDAHTHLFAIYSETLRRFADALAESDLRRFECALLQALGYGLTLTHDVNDAPIDPDSAYAYEIERGPVRLPASGEMGETDEVGETALAVRGKTLLDLANEDFSDPHSLAEAKPLMRALIAHYTGGRELESRKIFKEIQE